MLTLLHCGHVVTTVDYPQWAPCPLCGCEVKIAAFECREWHAKCQVDRCRFGRWYGQDESSARRHSHTKHQMVSVNYMVHPVKAGKVRKLYGRRVALIIPVAPKPRVRIERRPLITITLEDDIPPF